MDRRSQNINTALQLEPQAGGTWTDTNSTAVSCYDFKPYRQYRIHLPSPDGYDCREFTIKSDCYRNNVQPVCTPSAPQNLSVTAQTGGTSVELDWDAPTDTGGSAVTDYDVSSDNGTTWASTGDTATAYTLTGLDKGTEYNFRVRAVNAQGDGTASTAVTETTLTPFRCTDKSDGGRRCRFCCLIMDKHPPMTADRILPAINIGTKPAQRQAAHGRIPVVRPSLLQSQVLMRRQNTRQVRAVTVRATPLRAMR